MKWITKLPLELLATAALTVGLVNFSSAHAMMLTGGVQTNEQIAQSPMSSFIKGQMGMSSAQIPLQGSVESAEQTAARFRGKWKCLTTVVASNVRAVAPGTKVTCELSFEQLPNGQVKAQWEQKGWTSSESSVGQCANGALHMSHTNQFSRSWEAHADDYCKVTSPNTMISTSKVEQYSNGTFIGRYKTQSQLIKITGQNNVAYAPSADPYQ